jgi:response regulator of citrate/malate metabolism
MKNKMSKKEASNVARLARSAQTKKKVENAINLLRLYGDKINPNTIHKESGVSRATAKKYLERLGIAPK